MSTNSFTRYEMEGHGRYGLQSQIYCVNDGKIEVRSPNPAIENETM
jgi:hypothetical protein